uniref:Uncharacterized protein n=1 Tax=Cannabis sativa TaxID=3483 RepID=A0A803PB33_CANSA
MVWPADQGTRRPSRGAGSIADQKAAESATRRIEKAIPFLDEALKELGDSVADRLYSAGLQDLSLALMKLSSARDGSKGPSDAFKERVKVSEASFIAEDKANSEQEVLLAERQRMVSRLEVMLSSRNTENTNQDTLISGLQTDLKDHKKKL